MNLLKFIKIEKECGLDGGRQVNGQHNQPWKLWDHCMS
jgi:hypothetical protein